MKTYHVWGEYGPVAYMAIEYTVQAESLKDAREQAIQLLKRRIIGIVSANAMFM